MTDALWLGIIAGVPLTLTACGTLVLAVKTYAEAKTIAGHVNSEKSELLGKLAAKDMEITLYKEHINDLRNAAGLLAQAAATRTRQETPAEAVQSLKQIDTNTAAIAENTALKEPAH